MMRNLEKLFLVEPERLTCNSKEVQIKYAIMPNAFLRILWNFF